MHMTMFRAKETIQKSYKENEEKYKDILAIIDKRWKCQLQHPLHADVHNLSK